MGKFSDLLFGSKKGKAGGGADPTAPTLVIPVVVPITVPPSQQGQRGGGSDHGGASAAAGAGAAGSHEAETGGIETSTSMGSLSDMVQNDAPSTPKGAAKDARPSAWQRIRHNNSLGGLSNPLTIIRSKSKNNLKTALSNSASKGEDGTGPTAVDRAAAASPAPPGKTATVAPIDVVVRPPTAASTEPSGNGKSAATAMPTATTPIGGKPKAPKTNVTPLQLPNSNSGGSSHSRLEITGNNGASISATASPRSPNAASSAAAAAAAGAGNASMASDADSQHADILRRRRVELFGVLLGSHEILPEFKTKYELISDLGVGAFGFVISARDKSSNKEVAVKFISKESVPRTSLLYDDRLGMIPSEIFVLRRLKHPHILAYIESFADSKYYYLVTELHGDIWGPKGIEKDPVYTYRPLNASALIGTGSPGSSLNSREGVITSSAEKLPGSPRDVKRSSKASSLGSKERLDSPRDSVSTASTGGSATSTSTASPPATKSKKTGKMSKRSTGSASTPMNNILQLLKTKVENMDGRRHSVSLPPHGTVETIPQRLRKLSDPLWAHFQPSTMRRAYSRDLFDCIDLHRRLSEATARKVFSQLLSAVAYLQSQNLAHGDIKDENILVDRNFDVRLIDFGATSFLHQRGTQETFIGTMHYASPEILLGGEFDHASAEVWTLGILLYTMMVGTSPFNSATDAVNGRFRLPRYLSAEAYVLACAERVCDPARMG